MTPVGEYHDNIESAMAAGLADAGSRKAQSSLFNRSEWLAGLSELALPGKAPLIVAAKAGPTQCWLALTINAPRRAEALANYYNFTFEPVFHHATDDRTKSTLIEAIARIAAKRLDAITIEPMPDENGEAALTERAFRRAGWVVVREQCDVNHILNVKRRTFAEYWAARPGKLRSTVKRKAKKGVVDLRIETQFNDADWAAYEHVYANSWKPAEGSPQFLRELARAEAGAGALRLGLAHIDGEPVAAQFWTVENGTALIHKLAHVEDDAKASPGTLLTHALFEHVIDKDRVDVIDFGTGNDGYKPDWMEEVRPRFRLSCYRPAKPANWPRIAKALWRGVAARQNAD